MLTSPPQFPLPHDGIPAIPGAVSSALPYWSSIFHLVHISTCNCGFEPHIPDHRFVCLLGGLQLCGTTSPRGLLLLGTTRPANIRGSQTGRINIRKMAILPKATYRFNVISNKIPSKFFIDLESAILKFFCNNKQQQQKNKN